MVDHLRGWLQWSERLRKAGAIVAVVVLAVAAWLVVAALTPVPGLRVLSALGVLGGAGWCDEQPLACTVSKSVLSALAIGVLGLAGFLWWLRGALAKHRGTARDRPEDLFDWLPPGVAPPRTLGRESFIAMILGNLRGRLRRGARAQVIRGDSGSGKTTLLIELTRRLARENVLAVPVSLRNTGPLVDIVDLAKTRFARFVEDDVSGQGRAGRAWRQLCQDGRVVILADGLDEITTGSALQREEVGRRALDRARGRGVGLIVTSRIDVWQNGVAAAVHELPPLPEETWMPFIDDRMSSSLRDEEVGRLHAFVGRAGLGGRPVYLNLMARLYDVAAPGLEPLLCDEGASRIELRWRLLDRYLDVIQQSARGRRSPVGAHAISQVLEHLGWVAFAAVRLNTLEPSRAQVARALEGIDGALGEDAMRDALDGAARLGLVWLHEEAEHVWLRFSNAELQAFLAAGRLDANAALLGKLLPRSYTPEFGAALAFHCLRAGDRAARARELSMALIDRAGGGCIPGDARLPSLSTAADIAVMAGIGAADGLRNAIAATALDAWREAAHPSRLGAIPSLQALRTPASYELLWTLAQEPHYELRLAAAEALMGEASSAYRSLHPKVDETLAVVERPGFWSKDELGRASIVAWVLPSWKSLAGTEAPELGRRVAALAAAATRKDVHVGFEASLAQGFKLDAHQRPGEGVDACARELLPKVRFWYSGVSLVHALTIRAACGRGDGVAEDLARLAGDRDVHPFVAEAARLGGRAIAAGSWQPFVWRDEAEAIARGGRGLDQDDAPLDPEAARLLADVVVTLNLTERGDWWDRREEIQWCYTQRTLPHCLSGSGDRQALRTGRCPGHSGGCPFQLCPYPPPWGTGARGDFSEAFCSGQRELASARRHGRRPPLPWQPAIRREALVAFWDWMERRAEF